MLRAGSCLRPSDSASFSVPLGWGGGGSGQSQTMQRVSLPPGRPLRCARAPARPGTPTEAPALPGPHPVEGHSFLPLPGPVEEDVSSRLEQLQPQVGVPRVQGRVLGHLRGRACETHGAPAGQVAVPPAGTSRHVPATLGPSSCPSALGPVPLTPQEGRVLCILGSVSPQGGRMITPAVSLGRLVSEGSEPAGRDC